MAEAMITTSIRIPSRITADADRLVSAFESDPDAAGPLLAGVRIVRSDVLRAALHLGLESLATRVRKAA